MLNEWKFTLKQTRKNNHGQAILLVALVMIGLLAIGGLAIDGAGLMLLKRQTQNAADAGVTAVTYARCAVVDPNNSSAALTTCVNDSVPGSPRRRSLASVFFRVLTFLPPGIVTRTFAVCLTNNRSGYSTR